VPECIRPRRIEMWEFFNENIDAAGSWRLGKLTDLSAGDRKAAEFFIAALKGSRRVLDLGCGAGLPGLYLAEHVGSLVGLDAAPNMIAAARTNAAELGLPNALFQVGGLDALPFEDEGFDGASLCGVLESMDWEDVHRTISEVWRVLQASGRLAVLAQDWQDVVHRRPRQETSVRFEKGRLWLQTTERKVSLPGERDTRYYVAPESTSGRRLRQELAGEMRHLTTLSADQLLPEDIVDAWFYETAQFDTETLAALLESSGFHTVMVSRERIWTSPTLLATARKR